MKRIFFCFIIAFLFSTSCKKEKSIKIQIIESRIIRTNLPDSLRLGNQINLKLVFEILNGCGKFNELTDSTGLRELRLHVNCSYSDEHVCTTAIRIDSVYYPFFPNLPGKYKILLGNGGFGYLEDSLVVY